ncbi:FAD-dependent monooxygenase [Nocardiopsis sp. HNM0947]|uniref:FAD-dependent monooxygenase n=1 Tax=Nocardiopsis coralli TaxID=2772213 RepID=A0ABR9P252_9ACTN|nr:FAD-dependent monooxygenase [Nocardiopsis coralli]MBE2997918.1 FAD-dependent monooxygenase [Nocardiopsis coralli]
MTNTTHTPRALVVGLGIAGAATALRLRQVGWEPVVVERAPGRRLGGYFVGVFGTGQASASRLGVMEDIPDRSPAGASAFEVTRGGKRWKGMGYNELPGHPLSALRGDIEAALFDNLPEGLEIRYSTVPTSIDQSHGHPRVTLRNTTTNTETVEGFDLVVGADGLRSTVRRLVFGPDANHMHSLDYMIAVCLMDEPVQGFDPSQTVILAEPGRSAWAFSFKDRNPSVMFSWASSDIDAEFTRTPIESVRRAFGPESPGPVLRQLQDQFERAGDFLFDSVHQVRMKQWHHNRVALVGDAAWCMSLYSGMGASMGMAGAELLGTMLQRHGNDVDHALHAWQKQLGPFIEKQQEAAVEARTFFTPQTRAQQMQRVAMLRLQKAPVVGPFLQKQMQKNPVFAMKSFDIAVPPAA